MFWMVNLPIRNYGHNKQGTVHLKNYVHNYCVCVLVPRLEKNPVTVILQSSILYNKGSS